ncbi:hypothetical protein NBE99_05305 [Thermosynechococcus sp. HN-54]|uniref:hypothetical protein n=1 Tax=Thermosynechococcus sp. HN-54 TaxID=2933959 RepID=UPI00202CEF60|nr:hypothetical protein [Thermosynechococcus sp. HN-54]URR36553.1 hypothetical protein NBE99_05305 [Thermosynechococcus sp. HN-54]
MVTLLLAAFANPLPAFANRRRGGSFNGERSFSNRVNRTQINRDNINRNNRPNTIRNIDRGNLSNINRPNREQNIHRGDIRNANINRPNWNNANIDRRNRNWNNVNNRGWQNNRWNNNNIIVNPRWRPRWNTWWWNGSRPWYPTPNYWGGGFWGNLAIGLTSAAVAGAIAGSIANNNSPQVVVVSNSPGGQLLSSYELVQVPCSNTSNLVVILGPADSVICARPTALVPAGVYTIDMANLALIPDWSL